MSEVKSYRDLIVWQKAMELVVESYLLSRSFPEASPTVLSPTFGNLLTVPAYIADGQGREILNEYIQRLSWAEGSLKMLETYWLTV